NHDVPFDVESYVHRIGRTGRAGRGGTAILFITPRETRMLKAIERFTGQRIAPMRMPSAADVAMRRAQAFKKRLLEATADDGLEPYLALVEELAEEAGVDMAEIAAAAARLAAAGKPITADAMPEAPAAPSVDGPMVRLFVDAGREAGIRPGDIVGAIAGESDIPGHVIGAIDIHAKFTFVEIPSEYVDRVLERMKNVQIRQRPIVVKLAGGPPGPPKREPPRKGGKDNARERRAKRRHAA